MNSNCDLSLTPRELSTVPSRAPSVLSAPPDPHSLELNTDSNRERFCIRSRIDMFDRLGNDTGSSTSRERFQRARLALNERLFFKPSILNPLEKCYL